MEDRGFAHLRSRLSMAIQVSMHACGPAGTMEAKQLCWAGQWHSAGSPRTDRTGHGRICRRSGRPSALYAAAIPRQERNPGRNGINQSPRVHDTEDVRTAHNRSVATCQQLGKHRISPCHDARSRVWQQTPVHAAIGPCWIYIVHTQV
jgi:hypothetical protein